MKIAITGTHRVGKTSLIEKLHASLPEYQCIPEAYYALEEKGYIFSEIPTIEDYLAQLEHALAQISPEKGNVLYDRSPLDMLAYIYAMNQATSIHFQTLYQKVQQALDELDLLVFVPIEDPDLISCSASDLPELRQQVNDILNDWLVEIDVDVIKVTGSFTDRKSQVLDYIL